MSMREKLEQLEELRREASWGREKRIEAQHERGKLTARERLDVLLDEGSFVELDRFVVHRATGFGLEKERYLGDGVVTGYGTIHGRLVYVFSQDFTVFGGSLSEAHAEKIVQDHGPGAEERRAGDRPQRLRRRAHPGGGGLARRVCRHLPPQHPGLGRRPADLGDPGAVRGRRGLLARHHRLHLHGAGDELHVRHRPQRGEDGHARGRDHGGARRRGDARQQVGVAHFACRSRSTACSGSATCSSTSRRTTGGRAAPRDDDPFDRADEELLDLVPDNPNKPYDMHDVIRRVVDDGEFYEVHADYAGNILCGFAHVGGHSVGIVANQPAVLAGVLDIDASVKAARFVRFCDSFNIPLLTFEDVPGFLPGVTQEHGGIIRHGAKLLYAFCEATVPKVTIITRKAYGGAYDVMSSKHIRGDINYAWPTAEIAVMGAKGAVEILYRREIAGAEDPAAAPPRSRPSTPSASPTPSPPPRAATSTT
jgi:propionyl-CoA carboxylase beta chain